MRTSAVIALLAVVLAGCGSSPAPAPNTTAPAAPPPGALPPPPAPPTPVPLPPPPVSRPPTQAPQTPLPPPPPAAPPDQCGAWELQSLIGKRRTEIPVPVEPSKRRVICSTCPKTLDFSPERMTIEFDANTGIVTAVKCE